MFYSLFFLLYKQNTFAVKKIKMKRSLPFLFCFFLVFAVFGQKAKTLSLPEPQQKMTLARLDKEKYLKEDEQAPKGRLRCAIFMPVNQFFPKDGTEEKIEGGKIYRFQIDAPGAEAINLTLENFCLPKGAELTFYNERFDDVSPVFTWEDNPDDGIFLTDYFVGERISIELFIPGNEDIGCCFIVKEAGYMYRPLPSWLKSTGFGGSGSCEVNINCAEGKPWQKQKKSVARILLRAGYSQYWCTGALMNNTRKDRTPYFLTAEHCANGASESDYRQWKFYFNYEAPTCENPLEDPVDDAILTIGSTKLAEGSYNGGSDFLLLRLTDENFEQYYNDLYFNGWTISESAATHGVGIHHPMGDIKKISTYEKPATSYSTTHWLLYWVKTESNWGVTEAGSSGSPLFNQDKLVVGTLTGGNADCSYQQGYDLYGKMSYHWTSNGTSPENSLKTWLNPDNENITSLKGLPDDGNGGDDDEELSNIKVYPNPANDFIFIELSEKDEAIAEHSVKLYDLAGKCILHEKIYSLENILKVNIKDLLDGIYIVTLINKNGTRTVKITKKR